MSTLLAVALGGALGSLARFGGIAAVRRLSGDALAGDPFFAGTLVDVGRGRKKPGAVSRAYESGDRRDLGMTAPAQGLVLEHVELTEWGQDAWPPAV